MRGIIYASFFIVSCNFKRTVIIGDVFLLGSVMMSIAFLWVMTGYNNLDKCP